jgi:UDP-N-acetylmuramoylalanine--D-glutamate ligase
MSVNLKGKRISVIGAGRTGVATATVVRKLGGIPFVSDSDEAVRAKAGKELDDLKIEAEFGRHSDRVFECDMMIVSPGVPSGSKVITQARERKITVWPEIELAFRLCRGKIIGVTGSNGKTTTVTLIGEILKKAKRKVYVCGNIGHPFISIAEDMTGTGIAVVELSSFQLELIDGFRPDIAVFLNLTPDHLDRHGDLGSYMAAKMRIFENQGQDNFAVVNYDDQILRENCRDLKAETCWFSVSKKLNDGVYADPEGDFSLYGRRIMSSADMKIKGIHNLSNACAAAGAASALKIEVDNIVDVLKTFPGVEHRLEPVRLIGGVSFINDSKGTNVDSVRWALMAVSAPVILIAGGKDKDSDFTVLKDLVRGKVKCAILIGQAAPKILKVWSGVTECRLADDMRDAVRTAFECATGGDTVLLSPACASFDMFDNFEHRGRVFKEIVNQIASSGVTS